MRLPDGLHSNAPLRRAEPDAPYRRTDLNPIDPFPRNQSYPLKIAKNLFYLIFSRYPVCFVDSNFWAGNKPRSRSSSARADSERFKM